jgi:hypothetical protein
MQAKGQVPSKWNSAGGTRLVCRAADAPGHCSDPGGSPGDRPGFSRHSAVPLRGAGGRPGVRGEHHAGLVVEPSAALGIAAILEDRDRFAGRHVVTILCGSNVDLEAYHRWVGAAPIHRS